MTGGSSRLAVLTALAALLAIGLPACGGDDDSATTASPPASTQAAPEGGDQESAGGEGGDSEQSSGGSAADRLEEAKAAARRDSGGGADRFRRPGGDNSIQEFGAEASDSEREEAAIVLHAFLAAQADQDWAGVCSYLSQVMQDRLKQLAKSSTQLEEKDCEGILGAFFAGPSGGTRAELTEADVGSLRVDGESAFILYRGARNRDYSISMTSEGDAWKIGGLVPTALP